MAVASSIAYAGPAMSARPSHRRRHGVVRHLLVIYVREDGELDHAEGAVVAARSRPHEVLPDP
jgi:hypothetical protein